MTEPPMIAATLTLPPPGWRPSGSAATISAATAIALIPASGLAAAWAARPWTTNTNEVWPSARVIDRADRLGAVDGEGAVDALQQIGARAGRRPSCRSPHSR